VTSKWSRRDSNPRPPRFVLGPTSEAGALSLLVLQPHSGDGGSRTRVLLGASERSLPRDVPKEVVVRMGGVEPPQPEAARLRRAGLTCAQHPLRRATGRIRTDAAGFTVPGASRLHHGHHEAGTIGLEPTTSHLTSERSAQLSYAPEIVLRRRRRLQNAAESRAAAGGDFLRLMARAGFEPASRAHEAREKGPFSTAHEGLAGRDRTCGLRFPKPAGWPTPPQPDEAPPAGLEPAASGLRVRRHVPFDHGGVRAPAAGIEPAPRE
jgi:hypothetical protein